MAHCCVHWSSTGLSLASHWSSTSCILVVYWPQLAFHWSLTGLSLAFHWQSTGLSLAIHWSSIGLPLVFHCSSTGLPLVVHWPLVLCCCALIPFLVWSGLWFHQAMMTSWWQQQRVSSLIPSRVSLVSSVQKFPQSGCRRNGVCHAESAASDGPRPGGAPQFFIGSTVFELLWGVDVQKTLRRFT